MVTIMSHERSRVLSPSPFKLLRNPRVDRSGAYGEDRGSAFGGEHFFRASREITGWPGYAETPLTALPGLADRAGVGMLYYKDEGTRFGLGSFKALGGAYAVFRLLTRELERRAATSGVTVADLISRRYEETTRNITVTCATDGNHGRSVAWGAQLFGCRCVIYVHETVSEGRVSAIAAYGAEVRRNPGNYDDAVRAAARNAASEGWYVVSDTSYPGYTEVPRDVMQGYTVMVDEALSQLGAQEVTHVFVQGGVGGLAAAVTAHLWERCGSKRPRVVIVEPKNADCLYMSALRGELTVVHGKLDTIMAGLSCGEPSLVAWNLLADGADDFMTIDDAAAVQSMRLLAEPSQGDPAIVAGESAVAGLAGMLLAAQDAAASVALNLSSASVVLVFGTEGDTDPELYRNIVGRDGAAVRHAPVPA
jgi:diaminopropionate ammonia-lyase